MKYNKITTIAELNKELDQENNNFVMLLAGGLCRSSKWITYRDSDEGGYEVLNEIDDTYDFYSEEELLQSNIGKAMENGAFFCEIYE